MRCQPVHNIVCKARRAKGNTVLLCLGHNMCQLTRNGQDFISTQVYKHIVTLSTAGISLAKILAIASKLANPKEQIRFCVTDKEV